MPWPYVRTARQLSRGLAHTPLPPPRCRTPPQLVRVRRPGKQAMASIQFTTHAPPAWLTRICHAHHRSRHTFPDGTLGAGPTPMPKLTPTRPPFALFAPSSSSIIKRMARSLLASFVPFPLPLHRPSIFDLSHGDSRTPPYPPSKTIESLCLSRRGAVSFFLLRSHPFYQGNTSQQQQGTRQQQPFINNGRHA